MSNRYTAIEFIECFCAGDLKGLESLMAADLKFNGPLYRFDSRDAYLEVLKKDPPEPCGHNVLSVTESEDATTVFYEYQKSDQTIMIAQLFQFRDRAISEIVLVFDTHSFHRTG